MSKGNEAWRERDEVDGVRIEKAVLKRPKVGAWEDKKAPIDNIIFFLHPTRPLLHQSHMQELKHSY